MGESTPEIVSCRAMRACGRAGVRACVRAVWLPRGIGSQKFSLHGVRVFPFFQGDEFSISLPPHPQTSCPTLVGLIGMLFELVRIAHFLKVCNVKSK